MSKSNALELQRQQLQTVLDSQKTQTERNRDGQFSTPFPLANEIVEFALAFLPKKPIRFLDPGFGTGAFFSALLNTAKPSRIEAAHGVEIDRHYGEPTKDLWASTLLKLDFADFTTLTPKDKFNLVVSNPPYVRHHHMSISQKQRLKVKASLQTGLDINGLSGLYCYFMMLSQPWMSEGGIGAWLIPSEFMDVNYGAKVKQFLVENVTLLHVHQYNPDDEQFDDALVSSAVVFFRNTPPSDDHEATFTYGGTLSAPKNTHAIPLSALRTVPKWTRLQQRSTTDKSRGVLADLFTIRRGLATGCNEFFVMPTEKAKQLEIPSRFLKPILPSPRYLETDVVSSDEAGYPKIKNPLVLLDCKLPEVEIKTKHPALWKYLQVGVEMGLPDRYLCAHRQPWYSQEDRPATPFICTYMGRPSSKSDAPFRFILNHSQATAANVYLMLYPNPRLAKALRANSELKGIVWKALASIKMEMLQSEGRLYGGGLHKIEPKELAKVPADVILDSLPDATESTDRGLFD